MDKINYYLVSLEELKEIKGRPSMLLHACCGPCSSFPLTFLCPHFDVTIYYNNSNIFPEQEYSRRLEELKKLLEYFKRDYGYNVKLIIPKYDNKEYNQFLSKYEGEKEGGERCFACYEKRMAEAYQFAEDNGYQYFSTVMTVSRQKNSQKLNEIGKKLEKLHPNTKYFYSDFKKNKGQDKVSEMRKFYNLYAQQYCGCYLSYREYLVREENKKFKELLENQNKQEKI